MFQEELPFLRKCFDWKCGKREFKNRQNSRVLQTQRRQQTMQTKFKKIKFITGEINRRNIKFHRDTGSELTLIDKEIWERICKAILTLQKIAWRYGAKL